LKRALLVNESGHERTTPSAEDGDGVRVIRERGSMLSAALVVKVGVAMLVMAGIAMLLFSSRTSRTVAARGGNADTAQNPVTVTEPRAASIAHDTAKMPRPPQRNSAAVNAMSIARSPDDEPSDDPNDIASHFSPGDPAPTMTEVIQALHDMGDHTGIGAFNPPGTSPPLKGLAVPEDFELPAGYVRHHQVTDEGEPLEAILMFSPDGTFVDASGRAITIPEDRVVPPELAPPGLPIREITIPPAAMREP
jgi:hypothetical protein